MSKIAVYGNLLRKGEFNSAYLRGSKYLGNYQSLPIYTLILLGRFPGLIKEGSTSIFLEVYEIEDVRLLSMDFTQPLHYSSLEPSFKRELINTPYGEAYVYFYNIEDNEAQIVIQSGNWIEYKQKLK